MCGAAWPTQCCARSAQAIGVLIALQRSCTREGQCRTSWCRACRLLHAHLCLTHVSLALQARLHLAEGDGAVALQSLVHLMARVQQAAPHTEQHTEAQQHALRLQESDVSVCSSHLLREGFVTPHHCHAVKVHLAACSLRVCLPGGRMLLKGLHAVREAIEMT